ncbi:MAG: MFS transporter [Rhodobacteraceae bacterium]|nr:MFS transporter [Paracoccaceae bacterium]
MDANAQRSARRRILGWWCFDIASQPHSTLVITFIFGPYFATVVGDAVRAQTLWAAALTASGLFIAMAAPVMGAMADRSGNLRGWVWGLSALLVISMASLWFATPAMVHFTPVLIAVALSIIAVEMATIVTNAMLPGLAPRSEIGRLSGTGFALGYAGGLTSLIVMLLFFAENGGGVTLLGLPPAFGLDPETREGTRFAGPFSALWYMLFMVPFFIWVRPAPTAGSGQGVGSALRELARTLRRLPARQSLLAYLGSSMFYRDALNGLYSFGGLYAIGVLGWSITQLGVFGIAGVLSAAVASWLGGRADHAYGPKPVIAACIVILTVVSVTVVATTRDAIFGIAVAPDSIAPDVSMYICGSLIGGAGGALQAASRTMMVRHADPARPTEAFGLYALSGKATAFLAPLLIGLATAVSGDQRIGISPLIVLFLVGLLLLVWVRKDGDIADGATA